MLSENTVKIFKHLQSNNEGLLLQEVAAACDLTTNQITGGFNQIVKKGYGYRSDEKVTVALADGTEATGKQLFLNEAGLAADVDAIAAEK